MSSPTIHLPSKLKIIDDSATEGTYEIEGLFPGYGHTLGNSLRRIILSSLEGTAITSVKIKGVPHEFSTIEGIQEDVIAIILNLKKIRFHTTSFEPVFVSLKTKGAKHVYAKDIDSKGNISVLNSDQFICEITGKTTELDMEIMLEKGTGYVSKEMLMKDKAPVGHMFLDAIFSPIRRVSYTVEDMRVNDRTDYNRLQVKIETDGSIKPKEVLETSLSIMLEQIHAILNLSFDAKLFEKGDELRALAGATYENQEEVISKIKPIAPTREIAGDDLAEMLKTRVENLDFSTRTLNALSESNVRTLGGLARKTLEDLVDIPGLGPKSIEEIKTVLARYELELKD